jgi:putative transposase
MAAHGFSQRHACRLIEVDPKTVRRRPAADAPEVRQRLRDLAGERRRFGYRRLGVLLAREGMTMNHKKLYRLYREEGLTVRRRRGRKRATGTRAPMTSPQGPNQRWSLDFVADALSGAGGSGFWRSWTTSRARRSPWSSTPRSAAGGSCASSTP